MVCNAEYHLSITSPAAMQSSRLAAEAIMSRASLHIRNDIPFRRSGSLEDFLDFLYLFGSILQHQKRTLQAPLPKHQKRLECLVKAPLKRHSSQPPPSSLHSAYAAI